MPDLLEEAKRLSKALPVVGSVEPGESSLARARVVMAELVERVEQAERERWALRDRVSDWLCSQEFPDEYAQSLLASWFPALAAHQRGVEGG